ncbi:MAG: hypothetical protein IJE49_02955 [Agathobacter sp.]|nr:hypothetical protein [Agathobacter sp.]
MTNEKLYEAIGDVKEQHILEAKQPKEKKPYAWIKWAALAACLCFVISISTMFIQIFNVSSPSPGITDLSSDILQEHREDFSLEIDPAILAQFEQPDKVIKAYSLLTNSWFLSDKINDFSQVVTTEVFYVRPGGYHGEDLHNSFTYYKIDENGELKWHESWVIGGIGSGQVTPNTFLELSYEVIDEALANIDYEDYIVTHSQRMSLVLVWVRRSSEDLFLAYPGHPALTNFEIGGIYTLEEVQERLTEVYNR